MVDDHNHNHDGNNNDHSTPNHGREQLLAGWKQEAATTMMATTTWPHDERPTTRLQPHEQLLMGWITGGMMKTMTEEDRGQWDSDMRRTTRGGRQQ